MKKKIYEIFHPNNTGIVIDVFVIILFLLYLILLNKFNTTESYVLYLIMSYCLITIIIKIYEIVRKIINKIIDDNKFLSKYKNDYKLRYKLSLYKSLILNILYSVVKFILGCYYKSLWFIAFSLYYVLLVIIRTSILKLEINPQKSIKDEWIKYRKNAITLLSMNVILTMIILVIVNEKIIIKYPMFIAIGIAVYTFYITIESVVNLIKYRKLKSPLISSAKVVNIITSLISMLSLEVVMLSTFGADKIKFNEIMIMASGGGFSIVIITICVYMIIKSTEWLNDNGR